MAVSAFLRPNHGSAKGSRRNLAAGCQPNIIIITILHFIELELKLALTKRSARTLSDILRNAPHKHFSIYDRLEHTQSASARSYHTTSSLRPPDHYMRLEQQSEHLSVIAITFLSATICFHHITLIFMTDISIMTTADLNMSVQYATTPVCNKSVTGQRSPPRRGARGTSTVSQRSTVTRRTSTLRLSSRRTLSTTMSKRNRNDNRSSTRYSPLSKRGSYSDVACPNSRPSGFLL